MRSPRALVWGLLALQLALASCNGRAPTGVPKKPAASHPVVKASDTPPALLSTVATVLARQVGTPTTLTGKVKIVSDNGGGIVSDNGGGIISDNGGGIISNNTGNIVSDNGGGIIANNGGGIVANNGGGLTSKTKFGLLAAAPTAREFVLADATIYVTDATGARYVDEHGKPITATTDAHGNYKLSAVLPTNNVVLQIAVHEGGLLHGGELAAMVPRRDVPARTQPIDTASSLGAAYVLGQYVKGSQATYDKLPASEADNLYADIAAAGNLLRDVASYKPADLVARTESLRGQAPPVSQRLDEIKALLLGQAHLGAGRAANTVPLVLPNGLALAPDGTLTVGEVHFGRIRQIDANGVISTLADVLRGKAKQNFAGLRGLTSAPDGSILVASPSSVFKIAPDGTVTQVAGNGGGVPGAVDVPATSTNVQPGRLVVAPDGTIYIGEERWHDGEGVSRVLSVTSDGMAHLVPVALDADQHGQPLIAGLALEPDGALDVLAWDPHGNATGKLYRYRPGAGTTKLAEDLGGFFAQEDGGLARGPDGTLYVATSGPSRITAIAPDGTRKIIAGDGGPAGIVLGRPSAMLARPDGGLFVCDDVNQVVWLFGKDGSQRAYAGVQPGTAARYDLDDIPFNAPEGAAFDPAGGLIVAESGGNLLRRFDGSNVTTIAGNGSAGNSGDGGPSARALVNDPTGVAVRGQEIYFCDSRNFSLRRIRADGTIETLCGGGTFDQAFAKGQRVPGAQIAVKLAGLAMDAAGRPYWSTPNNQILRLASDGMVEVVTGGGGSNLNGNFSPSNPGVLGQFLTSEPADGSPAADATIATPLDLAFDAHGDLYFSDAGGPCIRRIKGLDGPNPTIDRVAGASLANALTALAQGAPVEPTVAAKDATLAIPGGIALDAAGNIYVGEMGTLAIPLVAAQDGSALSTLFKSLPPTPPRIRKIGVDGQATIIAGPGGRFFTDPHAEDGLVLPEGMSVAPDGRLAIVDTGANLIRILPAGSF